MIIDTIADCMIAADFYGNLYYQARETVYEIIEDNEEALRYFYGEIN